MTPYGRFAIDMIISRGLWDVDAPVINGRIPIKRFRKAYRLKSHYRKVTLSRNCPRAMNMSNVYRVGNRLCRRGEQ